MPRRKSAAVESPASRKSPRAATQAQAAAIAKAESPASTRGSRSRSTSSSSKAEKTSPAASTSGRGSRSRSRPGKAEENVEANEEVVEESTPKGRSSRRGAAVKEETAKPSPRSRGRLTRGGLQEEKKAGSAKKAAAKPQRGGRGRSRGRGKKQEEEEEEEEEEEVEEEEEEAAEEEEEEAAPEEEVAPVKTTPRGGRARGKQTKAQPIEEEEKPAEEAETEEAPSRSRRSRGGKAAETKTTPPKPSPKPSPRSRRGKAEPAPEEPEAEKVEEEAEETKEEPSPRGRRGRGAKKEPVAEKVTPPRASSRRSRSTGEPTEESAAVEEAKKEEVKEEKPMEVSEEKPEEDTPDKAGPSAPEADNVEAEEPAVEEEEAEEEPEKVPSGIETPPEEAAAEPPAVETPAEEAETPAEEEQMEGVEEEDAAEVQEDKAPAEPAAAEASSIPDKVEEELKPEVAAAPVPSETVSQLSPPAEEIADAPVEDAAPLPSEQVSEASVPVTVENSADASVGSSSAVAADSPDEVKESPNVPEAEPDQKSQSASLPDPTGIVSISPPVDEAETLGAASTEPVEPVSASPPSETVQVANSEQAAADTAVTTEADNNSVPMETVAPAEVTPAVPDNQQEDPIVPSRKRSYEDIEEDDDNDDDLAMKKAKVVGQQEEENAFEAVEAPAALANGSEEPQEKTVSREVEPDIVETQPMEVQQRETGAASGEGDFNVNMSVDPAPLPSTDQVKTQPQEATTGSTKEDDILNEYVVIEMSDVPGANSGPVQEAAPSETQLATPPSTTTPTPSTDAPAPQQSTESPTNHVSQTLSSSEKDPALNRLYVANPSLQSDSLVPAKQFSVVAYNILADCWMNQYGDHYTQVWPKAKDRSYRHNRFMEEIRSLDADIVCLQEVEPPYYESTLLPAMTSLGYAGDFKSRIADEGFREGEATFYKNSRFTLIKSEGYFLKELAEKEIESGALADDVKECVRKYINLPDVVLITNLQCKQTGSTLAVGNIHVIYGSFRMLNAQGIQISCAIKQLVERANNGNTPHIICGDFNSAPDTPGYQLACDGYLSDEMLQKLQSSEDMVMPDGSKSALVNHLWRAFQHTSSTLKSSYNTAQGAEPECTSFNHCLDYIFYSSGSLDTIGVLKVAHEAAKKETTGLPSLIFPSDHLSLKTVLSFK